MCRMIMALGDFSTEKVFNAAIEMGEGKTANHNGPTRYHPNGWGAVWHSFGGLSSHKSDKTISSDDVKKIISKVDTNFLAVHVRHATLAKNIGLNYTHPLILPNYKAQWYMMHNGFLPSIYKKLGMHKSIFDTREYYEYILPKEKHILNLQDVINKLNQLEMVGTSGNAIIVNPEKIYIVHWTMQNVSFQDYFTMYGACDDKAFYIASEIQTNIMPKNKWQPLKPSTIYEYGVPGKESSKDYIYECYRSIYA